jgi:F0F1-type ATP synthase assembly protein I
MNNKKFDFEEFDPKPLEPEDLEVSSSKARELGGNRSENKGLILESPNLEKLVPEETSSEESQSKQSEIRDVLTALSLVTQIGLIMFASIAIGLIGGMYLDRWLNTGHVFMIILTILGIASGFRGVYKIVMKLVE